MFRLFFEDGLARPLTSPTPDPICLPQVREEARKRALQRSCDRSRPAEARR